VAVVVAIVLVVLIGGAIVDLWTDVIWYTSVGFDSVFWTRLGAQLGLFVVGLVLATVVLLANLWIAGRLTPPVDPERPGRLRSIAQRVSQAQRQADRNARLSGQFRGPFGGRSAPRRDPAAARRRCSASMPRTCPTWCRSRGG
jgi:uncharacterized membrane protein (UPF0182 family)